jgi:hypothetical protein
MPALDNLNNLDSELEQQKIQAADQHDEDLAEFITLWKKLKENATKKKSQISDSILKAQAFKD